MADRETNITNAFSDELSFTLPEGGTTIEVNATVGSPAIPFYLVIDADDDDLREIVLVDNSKDSDTFTLTTPGNRGVDGTVDVEHQAGALVGVYPVAALWTDVNDRVDAVQSDVDLHDHDGVDTAQIPISNISGHNAAAHQDLRVVGEVIFHAGTSIPSGFLECDGQEVSRVTFNDLFTAIGTTWGAGDGSSTFNLPDLSDAVPLGRSASNAVGDTGGSAAHDHTNPTTGSGGAHSHTQDDTSSAGGHNHSNPDVDNAPGHRHGNPSTGNAGNHGHSNPNVNSNGGHNHGNAGGHSHGNPSTGSSGSHDHGMGEPDSTFGVDFDTTGSAASVTHEHNIGNAGGHSHSVSSTGSGGNHNHGTAGNHSHSQGGTGSAGGHNHSQVSTQADGDHGHSQGSTGGGGNHGHSNPNVNSNGGHSHTQGDTGESSSYPPYSALMALIRF